MLVVIRGAGDIATGIALRLYRAGIRLVLTDLPQPTSIRRTVCFSEAIRLGETVVEGYTFTEPIDWELDRIQGGKSLSYDMALCFNRLIALV